MYHILSLVDENSLFVQHEGVCMGSILGPTMAAFAMDLIESKFNLYEGHLPTASFVTWMTALLSLRLRMML